MAKGVHLKISLGSLLPSRNSESLDDVEEGGEQSSLCSTFTAEALKKKKGYMFSLKETR